MLFLAEAFTRPAIMHGLGKIGFTQSYTYFTWRTTSRELREYCQELVAAADHMRPNFWPNTPDILHEHLQHGGPAMFKIRAVLASMLSPSWGIYAGYELYEHVARPGAEEYLDNEKYQLRPRDWAGGRAGRRVAGARSSPGSTRSAGTTRPCTGCATCASTTSTTTTSCAGPSGTPTPATRCSWSARSTRATRTGRTPRWTCRRSASTGTSG